MISIPNKLFLANCSESQEALASECHLLLACHCPCDCQRRRSELACQPIRQVFQIQGTSGSGRRIACMDLANQEIPNYQVADFIAVLDLISEWLQERGVILMSEHGRSRAATLALLWLAFRGRKLSASSFSAARADFMRLYPDYVPWPGLVIFLNQEWEMFRASSR